MVGLSYVNIVAGWIFAFCLLPIIIAQDPGSVGLGSPCASSDQCMSDNIQCASGVCGGGGALCTPMNGGNMGFSNDCATFFCRNSMCTNLPITDIGGPCESDMDCEGFDYALYAPVYCGMDNRCGGTNATCQAQDGGVNGNSYDCVSQQCSSGRCTTALPLRLKGETCGPDIGECSERGVSCSPGGICGGEQAACWLNPNLPPDEAAHSEDCVSGICRPDSKCASTVLSGLGGPCDSVYDCRWNDNQCSSGVCGGGGAACTPMNGGDIGFSNECATFFCRQKNLPLTDIGGPCLSDQDCEGFDYAYYAPVYCGVDNRCGGTNASCRAQDGGTSGGSYDCVTQQCSDGQCTAAPAQRRKGETCGPNIGDCFELGIYCSPGGICGGDRALCYFNPASPEEADEAARSQACVSDFCKADGLCASSTLSTLGGVCDDSYDCISNIVQCASGVCGGSGAVCQAMDGTAEGESSVCASLWCRAGFCSGSLDPSPKPKVGAKRQVAPLAQVRQQLCPAAFTPCPVQPKGYECINIKSDIETCGACPGALGYDGKPLAVDCTSLPNTDMVSCEDGECSIGSCLDGFTYQPENNTCVAHA
ncbi:hypothetical protein NCC49_004737 [Naganishia albida]|nr:hypothetical protein NCC49_004737 [Naganishia albida]